MQRSRSTRYSLIPKTGGFYDKTECVKDLSTGLVWEGKPASGSRALTSAFTTNYDSTISLQKDGTSSPTQTEIDASTNSIGYKNSVNNTSVVCGYSDWRLPTMDELLGIVDANQSPKIDNTWFPNTQISSGGGIKNSYWTASPYSTYASAAYLVSFGTGTASFNNRSLFSGVRLVRCGRVSPACTH